MLIDLDQSRKIGAPMGRYTLTSAPPEVIHHPCHYRIDQCTRTGAVFELWQLLERYVSDEKSDMASSPATDVWGFGGLYLALMLKQHLFEDDETVIN